MCYKVLTLTTALMDSADTNEIELELRTTTKAKDERNANASNKRNLIAINLLLIYRTFVTNKYLMKVFVLCVYGNVKLSQQNGKSDYNHGEEHFRNLFMVHSYSIFKKCDHKNID